MSAPVSDVMSTVLDFERNVVLRAGAGTGKTEALTSLYVHLCAGATSRDEPLSALQVAALTFTEKAAAEMRDRIRQALARLAAGDRDHRISKSVHERLARKGRRLDVEAMRRAEHDVAHATIGTLHSFAASIVRSHAATLGLDPLFTVLDERDAKDLFEEVTKTCVMESLSDPEFVELHRDLGGLGTPRVRGLLELVRSAHLELAESGRNPSELCEYLVEADPLETVQPLLQELRMKDPQDAQSAWVAVRDALQESSKRKSAAQVALEESPDFGAGDLDTLLALLAHERFSKIKHVRSMVQAVWAAPHVPRRMAALQRLLEKVEQTYAARKAQSSALDFGDLSTSARAILRDHPHVRAEVQASLHVLMVDELQDTNVVQRDLVYLVRALSDVGARIPRGAAELEPRGLFVVGDRKQSIYGFRGADVTVFEGLAQDIITHGGIECALTTSYRTEANLVRAMNILAEAALTGRSGHPFDLGLLEHEKLNSAIAREDTRDRPVEFIDVVTKKSRDDDDDEGDDTSGRSEPAFVARWLRTRLPALHVREPGGAVRNARFRDVALLLPRFTKVEHFLRALDQEGVPYSVVASRGLFATVEARDMAALATVLTRAAEDEVALVAFLRSPMVLLSDRSLLAIWRVLHAADRGWSAILDSRWNLPEGVAPEERVRFERAVTLVRELSPAVDAVGLGECMRTVLRETDYAAVLAGVPGGTQRVANVDRLIQHVTELGAAASARACALKLARAVQFEEPEPEADVLVEGTDAVSIMTVHQSKGLEFPVVIAAELGRRRNNLHTFALDRELGLGVTVRGSDGRLRYPAHYQRVLEACQAREDAEARRLFYVQITRARDHLVLSGQLAVLRKELEPAVQRLEQEGLGARWTFDANVVEPEPTAISSLDATATIPPELNPTELARRMGPATHNPQRIEMTVTQLEDFALCARRYRGRHLLGLEEYPRPVRTQDDNVEAPDIEAELVAKKRGTNMHAVLQHLDFTRAVREPLEAFNEACRIARVTRGLDELRARMWPFLTGPFVARATHAGTELYRETPFTLAVPADDNRSLVIRGQIDLIARFDGDLHVIDYKTTEKRGTSPTDPWKFQLALYAHAVQSTFGAKVRTAIQFLDGRESEPTYTKRSAPELDLQQLARAVFAFDPEAETQGLELRACETAQCGYRWLCHNQIG